MRIINLFGGLVLLLSAMVSASDPNSDFNGDSQANLWDFEVLAFNWLADCDGLAWCDSTGGDQSGNVNVGELRLLADNWLTDFSQPHSPVFEVQGDSADLVLTRDTSAYNSVFEEVGPNVKRTETVCSASRPEFVLYDDQLRNALDVDQEVGAVLFAFGDGLKKLGMTSDGTNFVHLADITSDPNFALFYESGDSIRAAKVLDDGSWLLVIGQLTTGKRGHIFRSEDKGFSWRHVLQYKKGFSSYFGMCAEGNEVLAPEYGWSVQTDNPRRVYYSNDYGRTWSVIYYGPGPNVEGGEPGAYSGNHCHLAVFSPGNTDVVYVAYGDIAPHNTVHKLVFQGGDKRDASNWIEAPGSPLSESKHNPVYALSDGKYLYWGLDAGDKPLIYRHDPADDTFSTSLIWPRTNDFEPDAPYFWATCGAMCFSMHIHEGVYYAAVRSGPLTEEHQGGIYVSVDGENWVCAYRVEGSRGFFSIDGYANGYLWGRYCTATNSVDVRLYRITPVRAANVEGLHLGRGVANILNLAASSFEGQWNNEWSPYALKYLGDWDSSGVYADPNALHGDNSYKVVCQWKDNGQTDMFIRSDWFQVPASGGRICASFWMRGGADWPDAVEVRARLQKLDSGSLVAPYSKFYLEKYWKEITLWGTVPKNDTPVDVRMMIYINQTSFGELPHEDYGDATFFMDCVQVVIEPNMFYSGHWQAGGSPKGPEEGTVSLTNLPETFTMTFEWRPDSSSKEVLEVLPITSWSDSNSTVMQLYWNPVDQKFYLSDGSGSELSSQSYTWEFVDSFKFAIVSSGGQTSLYLQSSFNDFESIAGSNGVSLTGSPVQMRLGTNGQLSPKYGVGIFHSIRGWSVALELVDIEKVFNMPGRTIQ